MSRVLVPLVCIYPFRKFLVRTRVPIRVIVNNMPFQAYGPRERLPTRLAGIRFYPRMCPHVYNQIARLGERLVTCLTDMWFYPRMRQHMLTQVTVRRECFFALLTHIRFHPRMRPHVPSQNAGLGERFSTIMVLTSKWFPPRMSPHVFNQATGIDAHHFTFLMCTLMFLRTTWHAVIPVPWVELFPVYIPDYVD